MPFAVDSAHRQFFHSHGWISFEQVLSEIECQEIAQLPLAQTARSVFSRKEADLVYKSGRDWHAKNTTANKLGVKLGAIAAGLWNQRPLLLLADQMICFPLPVVLERAITTSKGALIEQICSCQSMLGVLIVALSPQYPQPANDGFIVHDGPRPSHVLPKAQGEVLFLKADQYLKITAEDHQGAKWWMLAFGSSNARYMPNPIDPLADHYRQRGVPENGQISRARVPIITTK